MPPPGARLDSAMVTNALLLGAIYSSFVFCRNFFPVTSEAIRRDPSIEVHTSDISKILVAAGIAFGLAKAGIGVLIDCIGDGRISLWIFMVATSVCTLAFAGVSSVSAMLILAAVNGAFQAGAYPAASKVIYEMYPESMWGRMVSVLSIGSRVGALLTSVVLGTVLHYAENDWRFAVRVAPLPVGVIFVISIAVLCRKGKLQRASSSSALDRNAAILPSLEDPPLNASIGRLPPARASPLRAAEEGGGGGGTAATARERELDRLTAQLSRAADRSSRARLEAGTDRLGLLPRGGRSSAASLGSSEAEPLVFRSVVTAPADERAPSPRATSAAIAGLNWTRKRGGEGLLSGSAQRKFAARVRKFGRKISKVMGKAQFWYVSGASGCLLISKGFEAFGAMYIGDVVGATPSVAAIAVASIPAGIVLSVLLGGIYIEGLPPRRKARWTVALSVLNVAAAAALMVVTANLEHREQDARALASASDGTGSRAREFAGADLALVCTLLFVLGFSSGYGFYVPSSMYALRSGGSESATVIGMSEMVQAAFASSFVLIGACVRFPTVTPVRSTISFVCSSLFILLFGSFWRVRSLPTVCVPMSPPRRTHSLTYPPPPARARSHPHAPLTTSEGGPQSALDGATCGA